MPSNLDKFYTQPQVAKQCYDFLIEKLPAVADKKFLEPSAGCGNFLNYLNNYIALDIQPEDNRIIKQDFLEWKTDENELITIGNPPFGSRSKTFRYFF